MEFFLGFAIAILIGLTGVGGGVITAPVLTLFLGVPPVESVGTALLFTAVVKAVVAPVYLVRRQVNFRVLGQLLAGGLPGVLIGSYALNRLGMLHRNGPLLGVLGVTVVSLALFNLYHFTKKRTPGPVKDRSRWLPLIAFPIGAEVGFSSAGAGALGSLVLMTLTPISTAAVVGTDVLFGLGLSMAGGGISLGAGNYQGALALKLCLGGVAGAFVGANLLSLLPSRPLRVALSLWLVSLGGQLCWRAITG
ncbi:MAG TPA: sulfite exporter TauE/SafE family protein [Bryobacteraceae bacterium]|nr:sulfite exporter TauE/SafE family protein [Bryobacteraceae bacterium]